MLPDWWLVRGTAMIKVADYILHRTDTVSRSLVYTHTLSSIKSHLLNDLMPLQLPPEQAPFLRDTSQAGHGRVPAEQIRSRG